MEATPRKTVLGRIADEMYTCCAFWIAVSTLPALALSYVVVRLSKRVWLKLLSSRYTHLEFISTNTIRSLLDTHRNQGIINVLLSIKGQLNIDKIKEQLTEHVVERRDKQAELMFPRLRQALISCWGNYAWDANVKFCLENHFILASGIYRGRPVTDNNIQEYVSEFIAKYLPNEQSPWQYIVIPCVSNEPKFYVLVRVHHLLLTGKKSINIGDMLLVEQSKSPDRTISHNEYSQQSPLAKLFPTPSAIPELWEKLNESLTNAWNEFISEYDPVECPRALKSPPGAFHVAGLALVAGASAFRNLTKHRTSTRRTDTSSTSLIRALRYECHRRNITLTKVLLSPLVTGDPRKWPRCMIGSALSTARLLISLPGRLRNEVTALRTLRDTGHVHMPNTWTWQYAGLAKLCARAAVESWRGAVAVYRAPAELWTDTVLADDGNRHALQTVSLCGRKVTAWSRPVSRAGVERAARALGVSTTDIVMYAATEALRSYFEQAHTELPETILTTARAATEDFLFTFAEGEGKEYKKSQTGGMVCLSLPVGASPRRIGALVAQACARQGALAGAWAAQARYGALTRSVPSPAARLALNLLSRRYAVSYAEINAPPDARARPTLWGDTLDYVVYWRPSQANISMSLTVIQYAESVRLAVMTDAQLSPGHAVPAARWSVALDRLIAKVDQEIARISAQVKQIRQIRQIPYPLAGTHSSHNTQEPTDVERQEPSIMLRPPSPVLVSPPPSRKKQS